MRARNWTSPMRPTMLGKARIDAITLYGRANQLSVYQQAINAARTAGGPYLDIPDNLAQTWQDSAGTIPAAIGSTVGLLTDRSFGGELGGELVTGFSVSGTNGTNTATAFSDGFTINQVDASSVVYGAIAGTFIAGRTYELNCTATITAGSFKIDSPPWGGITIFPVAGRLILRCAQNTSLIDIYRSTGGVLSTGSFRNISVRELKGNHATQSTAGNRFLLELYNGHPMLRGNGTSTSAQLATNPIGPTLSQPYTIIVGGVVGVLGATRCLVGDSARLVRINSAGRIEAAHGGIGAVQSNSTFAAGDLVVVEVFWNAGAVTLAINGVVERSAVALAAPITPATAAFIGQRGNALEFWNGLLLPVFATGSVVPEAQRRQIGRGMAQKLGVVYV